MVYPANAFDSRLRGDQVPLGSTSSPTKSQKKKKDIELVAHSELLCNFIMININVFGAGVAMLAV